MGAPGRGDVQLCHQRLSAFVQHITDTHLRARTHECTRERFTQAARATGNQHLAALQVDFSAGEVGWHHADRLWALGK